GPRAYAGLRISGDVGRVEHAEGSLEGPAAGEARTALPGMAHLAVGGLREISAACHQIGRAQLGRHPHGTLALVVRQADGTSARKAERSWRQQKPSADGKEHENDESANEPWPCARRAHVRLLLAITLRSMGMRRSGTPVA